MGRKSAVGVANGNWRGGDYYRYAQEVKRGWNREQLERMMSKKKMRAMYWRQRFANSIDALKQADPQGWERWYDDDKNVPADALDREFASLVEARVIELTGAFPLFRARARRGIFIWEDMFGFFVYSKEVGKEPLYVIEFESFEQSESFIQGLPYHNCGYGVVLDLFPTPLSATPLSAITPTSPQMEERHLEGVKGN